MSLALAGLRVAIFGLGEAGSLIAADLAASGATLTGYDPAPVGPIAGVTRVEAPHEAVADADLVLAVTASADARTAAGQALDRIDPRAVYADLSTSAPGTKRAIAELIATAGLGFVDVALMASVPGRGLGTPQLAAGPAARRYVELIGPAGAPIEVVGDLPGLAATRKLLRSIVIKGLAGLVIESMRAANAAGFGEETWANLVAELQNVDEAYLRRMVAGSGVHAERRFDEMEAAVALLAELATEPTMTRATVDHLEGLRATGKAGLPYLPELPERR